ncbi:MAG: flagellar hook-basal body complex protein, partial [Aquincola sp.]|nr:flagellar hook-basal body complex protein [Aquincola sp.]
QYGAPFGVTNLSQNGYAPGQITGITIESTGIITARYSNGQNQPAGQIELATFRNPQGLQPLGGNVWARSSTSGDPIVGVPGQGNLGALQAGALEESNVDLTAELVSMMTAQRIYQANAQTIRTQDQVLQTLVQLR